MPQETENIWEGVPVISSYTRAQAIEDGTLADVTKQASNGPDGMLGGFTVPVAVTASVWNTIEAIPDRLKGIADTRGRLHDVLMMANFAARGNKKGNRTTFKVIMAVKGCRRKHRELVVDIGPGDDGEPVVTIGYSIDF